MRRIFITIILVMVCAGMFAQSVTLTFTGRGSGGIVTEEIYQQIDSIQVRNITHEWVQMIYYPDTVVVMEPLAVPMLDVRHSGLDQNVPNPFDCVTEADLTLYEGDVVTLAVVGANGVEYAKYNGKLGAGTHKFEITLSVPQAYLLTATTSTGKYSIKMVNLGSCGTDKIVLKSSSYSELRAKDVIENTFSLGDQMEYLAFTTYNNRVFDASELRTEQNGSEDIVIHFNIPYCNYSTNPVYEYGCDSYTWINGQTYTQGGIAVATMNLTSSGGCDSIVILNLTIEHDEELDEYIEYCQPIQWNGQNCNSTGEYIATSVTQGGCTKTVTLHFTRVNDIRSEFSVEDCQSYVWSDGGDFEQEFTETGDYTHTFTSQYGSQGGCDSIVTLHFTKMSDFIVDSLIACDHLTWDVNNRDYEFGDNYSFTMVHHYDTVRFTNQYGCDSIRVLNLTLYKVRESMINITNCGTFTYHGETYTQSGTYSQTIPNFNGTCDSIVTLNLTITPTIEEDIYPVSCDYYEYNGQTYTQSCDQVFHFSPRTGCDSIVIMHLVINHSSSSEVYDTACDSYTWFGEEYNESGDYYHTIPHTNVEGCDSTITLHLTVNHSKTFEKTINACREYVLDGERITETGDYYGTYTAENGCDSTVTYHINIFGDVTHEFTQLACESFVWDGTTYSQTGDYYRTYPSFVGCDSVVTMHLFIGSPDNIEDEQIACGSYEWEGTTYIESGNYQKTLTNIYGCDSVVTLRLTINPTYNVSFSHTECDSYEWEGTTYTVSGTYPKTLHSVEGCDSVVTLNLTIKNSVEHEFWDTSCGPYEWDGRTYTESGDHPWTYPAANGCDSVVTLHLDYRELVVDDRDGYTNTYCTKRYGNQVWMTSNMKYLPQVDNNNSLTASKYYVYGFTGTSSSSAHNRPTYNTYGVLYNYNSALTACPEGWHLPSEAEWNELVDYLGQNPEYTCSGNSNNVAKALASTEYWTSSSTECAVGNDRTHNNASEFNAVPGGYFNGSSTVSTNSFLGELTEGCWWTSTSGRRVQINNNSSTVNISGKTKSWGFSVRCVKDSE
ncbi:MAG: fibrobacter succinogenes major paralogous domain-containing protein [Bacteroidales bacterium]|nr:fibrobacter succinogenes major paralogous domain-containing protein [Bacteroidales bacterium]